MIFYFSGTGNTLWAARRVAEALKEPLHFVPDLIDDVIPYALGEGEPLGFIFPVHGWRPPQLIRRFIEKMVIANVTKQTYVFALTTAGDSIGRTMEILATDMLVKGWHLDAAFSLIMPESYVGLPFMDVDPKEKEQRKKQQAEADLNRYIPLILKREKTYKNKQMKIDLHRGPIPGFFSGPVGSFFVSRLVNDKRFQVETERCISCGKCEQVCPVRDIWMKEGPDGKKHPTWVHNGRCLTCFTCYHHCPTHAIEFGKQTQKKGQYYYKE